MRLLLLCCGLLLATNAFSQCDRLSEEPEFGVVNTWKPKNPLFALEVNFETACLARSQCYLKNGSVKSRCDIKYHEALSEICRLGYQFDERIYGQCMHKVNDAAKLVELQGGQYYRSQKRKADANKREEDRKARVKKRKQSFLKRADERRKKRMGR